eukprot:EG_transcript_5532
MDLQGAREVESTLQRASTLTDLLSQIVRNLEMLKPHAPEAVYVAAECKQEEDNLEHSESSVRASRTASSISMWDWQRASDRYSDHTDGRSPRRSIATVHQAEVRSTGKVVAAKNPTLGLVPMFLSVLRIRLMELDTVLGTDLDKDAVECALLEFMEVITAEATTHHGTILSCSNGVAIVMWQTRSPDPALECATAIQHNSKLSVVQVVQCGRFLCGNLATDLTHSFNVLGSFDFYSQQLLRVAGNRCHVLITTPEWERVGLKRRCLPLERVLLGTQAVTVYSVIPDKQERVEQEWLYEFSSLEDDQMKPVNTIWEAYSNGRYEEALDGVRTLSGLPQWYTSHLAQQMHQASRAGTMSPAKCLQTLAWPTLIKKPAATPRPW